MSKLIQTTFIALTLLLGFTSIATAVDTLETFDPGASDFEFYAGFSGIGLAKYEKGINTEILYGYGLIENFSATVTASFESNEYFGNGNAALGFGICGTPVDTDHFDLDLILNAAIEGGGLSDFSLIPALEMNFDLKPDQELWGMFLIFEQTLASSDESVADDPATTADESKEKFVFRPVSAITLGTYLTIAKDHQLLLQFDVEIPNNPEATKKDYTIGGIALGYNVVLQHYQIQSQN